MTPLTKESIPSAHHVLHESAFKREFHGARQDALAMADQIVQVFNAVLDGTVELAEQDNAYVITVTPADPSRPAAVLTLNYSVRRVDGGRLER